ncbi:hypothetical protein ABPG75_007230 [Micractinium tetrahymenae]
MQACMLPQQVPALAGPSPSPLLHPGPPQPAEMHALVAWQQQRQQPPPQQPAAFVPSAAGGVGDGLALLASKGWQQLAGAPAEQLEQQQQQEQRDAWAGHDDDGGMGKKGRLRWTAQLHTQFVAAVEQLGGAFAATPKRILAVMAIPNLTLLQVKSHLQKYRNALGCPGGGKRCGGGAHRKRSAASLLDGGSGSGACSDEEGIEDGPDAAAASGCLSGAPENRSHKRSSPAAPSPLAAAAAAAGMPADGPFGASAVAEPLLPGWGSEPDLEAIDGELAATLAPAGSLTESDRLLDMQAEGLQELDEALSRELSCWASQAQCAPAELTALAAAAAADEASDGTATRALSGAGSDGGAGHSNSGASHAELWTAAAGRSAAAPAAAAGGSAGSAGRLGGGAAAPSSPALPAGLPADEQGLLQAALKMQVEMQRQLSSTIEAQRSLQLQMEAHGKYIETLLRSEGSLPPKPAPKEAGKARTASGRSTGSGRSGRTSGHQRTSSMRLEPSATAPPVTEAAPIHRSNSAPAVAEAAPAAQPAAVQQEQPPLEAAAQPSAPPPPPLQIEQAERNQAPPPPQQQQVPPAVPMHEQAAQRHLQPAPQAGPAPAPSLARTPSWQLQQKFMQQQLQLERSIQQRLAELQQEAERQRRLLEQQQQQEAAATAALPPDDLDFLLLSDLPPGSDLDMGAGEAGPGAQPVLQLQAQASRFSDAGSGWVLATSPDAQGPIVGCPPAAAMCAPHAPVLSPGQPSCTTQALPPAPLLHPGWAAPAARAGSGAAALTGTATGTGTAYCGGDDAEERGQGCAASAPPPKRQQLPADRLQPPVDMFDAAMWDSLLTDAGVLQQLMDP